MKILARLAVSTALLTLAACPSTPEDPPPPTPPANPGGNPTGETLTVTGLVTSLDDGSTSLLSGATVTLRVDRGRDGTVDTTASTTTNDEGEFTVSVAVQARDVVVVAVSASGMASSFRTIMAAPGASTRTNVVLRPLQALECADGTCRISNRALTLSGMPGGLSGSARLFNPVTETNAFPGGFDDAEGNLLLSGVFSAIELTDENGDEVTTLETPAELCMQMPQDTWGIVVDITPGNGQIDVPLYAFDEVRGTWVRDGEAILQDAQGVALTESDTASVRDGTFAGSIKACGPVKHFSYWNVDWPIDTHGCITGTVTDADGAPVPGAVVTVRGETYVGVAPDQTTGADGKFCVDVMRSEASGEDVDNDGVTGETQRVNVRVRRGLKVYDGGSHALPTTQSTCGEASCHELPAIALTPSKEITPSLCTFSGQVQSLNGAPVSDLGYLVASDDTVDAELYEALCMNTSCTTFGTADENGNFSMTLPVFEGLSLWGYKSESQDVGYEVVRHGELQLPECPTTPVRLTLDDGYTFVTLEVSIASDVISWSPASRASYLSVVDGAGEYKWFISVENEGDDFGGPVTYGTTPAGGVQIYPVEGSPPAIASGDRIQIVHYTVDEEGFFLYASGEVTF